RADVLADLPPFDWCNARLTPSQSRRTDRWITTVELQGLNRPSRRSQLSCRFSESLVMITCLPLQIVSPYCLTLWDIYSTRPIFHASRSASPERQRRSSCQSWMNSPSSMSPRIPTVALHTRKQQM